MAAVHEAVRGPRAKIRQGGPQPTSWPGADRMPRNITAVTPPDAADMACGDRARHFASRGPPARRPITANLSIELIRWSLWPAVFCSWAQFVNTLTTRLDYFRDMSDSLER